MDSIAREELRAGVTSVLPLLIGVVPFGLVAGAAPVEGGLGALAASGFSVLVFAGASQLAAIEVLAGGGSWTVAALAACTINLRMLLYSASLAPFLSAVPLRRRLLVAYGLVDQAYAVSITRWSAGRPVSLWFYAGVTGTLWAAWQASTIVGALGGGLVPDGVPLEFAVPLVFLVLLVPAVTNAPAIAAVVAATFGALVAPEIGLGDLYIVVGAVLGITAGAVTELMSDRRTPRTEADV